MSPSITLVVPNKDDSEGVLQIFESLVHWVKLPDEIIVVDLVLKVELVIQMFVMNTFQDVILQI